MANASAPHPLRRIFEVLRYERREISAIYFYVLLGGLVQLSLPLGIQSIISFVMGGAISTSLIILIVLVIAGVLVNGILSMNTMKVIEKVQQQLFVRYSFEYGLTLPRLRMQALDHYYLPELVNRFFDTLNLQKGITKILLDVPASTVQIVFGLILLSFYHPVFIGFGIALILILWALLRITGARGIRTSYEESNYKYATAGFLQEMARSISSFKFAGASSPHLLKMDGLVTGYLTARTSHFRILQFQYWTLIIFKVLVTAAMLIVGAYLLVDQQISVGQFVAAEIIIFLIVASVEKLIVSLDAVYDVLTAVEKVNKVLDQPQEPAAGVPLPLRGEGIGIELNGLRFGYTQDEPILKGIDLSIKPGEKVVVTGSPASGKSTLLQLLSGAYPDYEGRMLIDGLSLEGMNLDSYRTQVGVRLSGHRIFEGSLWENIAAGREGLDRVWVQQLIDAFGLDETVDKQGMEWRLLPGGQGLSGRTSRSILLVRALAGKPRLLLLENPLDGLDEASTNRAREIITRELPNISAVIVAHDPLVWGDEMARYRMEDGRLQRG